MPDETSLQDGGSAGATPVADAAPPDSSLWVQVAGFEGPLDELVRRAQHHDVDLNGVAVAEITAQFRRRISREGQPDLREVAEFLTLAARLVALKAAAVLPDTAPGDEEPAEDDTESEAGQRLAEYRLFRAAAEALLADAAEEGARSFLGMVSPEVIPVERLRIPPERLAAAFRSVLERLAEAEPLPVGAVTFSVEDKVAELRQRLAQGRLVFDDIFRGVGSRLEAVACFLALLELLKRGEATVEQREPYGPITVDAGG